MASGYRTFNDAAEEVTASGKYFKKTLEDVKFVKII
jgi:hypothetical protein